jgi:hypothetical protein
MAEIETEIETKPLKQNRAKRGLRVQVNNQEEYQGELGIIIEINEGCSCSAGWCRVKLDKKNNSQKKILEDFRYGKNGDVSDLLEVTKEPPRPTSEKKMVTPENVAIGLKVKLSEDSEYYNQAPDEEGKIISFRQNSTWVRVEFLNRYQNSYRFGHQHADNGESDLVISE